MFKMITWPQYLFAVAILLVLYYAYVALVYYRGELISLVTGKGKSADNQTPAPTPASLLNRGPLIPKAAVALPPSQDVPEVPAAPNIDDRTDEVGEEDRPEQTTADVAERTTKKESEIKSENDFPKVLDLNTEKFSKFTADKSGSELPTVPNDGSESVEEFDDDFTIGVTQLNSYFKRAAKGEITQQKLVKEVPALKNTEVLMAFFKDSTRSAQQLTAATYANVAEPVLD